MIVEKVESASIFFSENFWTESENVYNSYNGDLVISKLKNDNLSFISLDLRTLNWVVDFKYIFKFKFFSNVDLNLNVFFLKKKYRVFEVFLLFSAFIFTEFAADGL